MRSVSCLHGAGITQQVSCAKVGLGCFSSVDALARDLYAKKNPKEPPQNQTTTTTKTKQTTNKQNQTTPPKKTNPTNKNPTKTQTKHKQTKKPQKCWNLG